MIKRVFWIALYTGVSQVLSLYTISYVIRNLGEKTGGYIAILEANILVMAVIISFGIQFAVNRNVATRKRWHSNYSLSQSARLTVGLSIVLFGIISYFLNWDITKWIFLIAPLIALNGDYALYGSGMPVKAARLSMFRVALPNLAILIGSKFIGEDAIYLYMVFAGIGILNSGFWASRINKVPYLYTPAKNFIKIYWKNYKVGIWQLSHVFLLTGILVVAKSFYTVAMIGLVYGVLKYYEVLKGVLRIIWQAFFRELGVEGNNLRIDKAGILLGTGVLIPTILFPNITIAIIYGSKYDGLALMLPLFGIAMFLASFRSSSHIQVMMNRKDNYNLFITLAAVLLTLSVMIALSFTTHNEYGIPIAIILGEFVLLMGLGLHLGGLTFFRQRLLFLMKLVPVVFVCYILKLVLEPSIINLALCMGIYLVWTFFFYKKLLFDSSFVIEN